jgi:hypothetical protein
MIDTAKMIDSAKRRALAMRIAILPSISGPFPQKKAHYGQSIAQFAPGDKLAAAPRASLRQYRKYQIFGLGLLPTSHTKRKPPMSALGQKQTFRLVRAMSAIHPKADMEEYSSNVRFVPKADILRCGRDRRYSIIS